MLIILLHTHHYLQIILEFVIILLCDMLPNIENMPKYGGSNFKARGAPLNIIQFQKKFSQLSFIISETNLGDERFEFSNFNFHHMHKGHPKAHCVYSSNLSWIKDSGQFRRTSGDCLLQLLPLCLQYDINTC
jgi:hypothetical protein